MDQFLAYTVIGVVAGCIYAITAAGLVVTYTTTGIFNFAHGAIGMLSAFAYWQLSADDAFGPLSFHLSQPVAALIVIFVLAPLFGAIIERVLMRPIRGASLDVTLTVTLGLFLLLLGVAVLLWDPTQPRILFPFFRGASVTISSVVVTEHQLVVVSAAVAVAIALRIFLYRTRTGTALRAVVDNPELTALAGASPARFGQLGWAIGAMLAGVAGVLLAALVSPIDATTLTLLVINAFAAAMVGRLRNLPLTFAGGIALGLTEAYLVGYLPVGAFLSQVKPTVPMVFLFVVLLVLPERRIAGRTISQRAPRVAGLWESIIAGGALVGLAFIIGPQLSRSDLQTASHGVVLGLIMLSLVLLVGYGGQVSLCQMTFAGLGAFAMGQLANGASWWGVAGAVGLSAVVGALVALPALRLRGLYLALATLAFAQAMDTGFFLNEHTFGISGSLSVGRVHLPGISLRSDQSFLVFVCVVFALVAVGILALRRGSYGRRLRALADSPAASATIGMNLTATKLTVFALSAGLAGLAGALYGQQQGLVGEPDFQLLLSLTLLLLAVVWGIRTMTGVLVAGLIFAFFPVIQTHVSWLRDLTYLGTGLAAIGIGRNPNGVFGGNTLMQKRRDKRAAAELQASLKLATADESSEAVSASR
jgi:branched-chain amino acid transport system permease protein